MIGRRAMLGMAGIAAMASLAAAQGLQVEPTTQPFMEDDVSPMMAAIFLLAAVVCLAVLVIGVVLGVLALVAAGVLLAIGMVSLSTLVAIARKSVSAGMRVLLYQVFGFGGLLAGTSAGQVAYRLHSGRWEGGGIGPILIGGAVGVAVALGICWMFLTAIRMLIRVVRPENAKETAERRA